MQIKSDLLSLRDNIKDERGQIVFNFNYTFAIDIIENSKYYIEEYGYENIIMFIDEELYMINSELSNDSITRRAIDSLWYEALDHLDFDYNFVLAKIEYLGNDISNDMRELMVNSIDIVDLIEGFSQDGFQKRAFELLPKEVLVKKILKKFEK